MFEEIGSIVALKRLSCVWNLPDQLGSSNCYLVAIASRLSKVSEVNRNNFPA